jgi:signal transduction histidine kinase
MESVRAALRIYTGAIAKHASRIVFAMSLVLTAAVAMYLMHVVPQADRHIDLVLLVGLVASLVLFGIARSGFRAGAVDAAALGLAREALTKHAERLRILHEIDRALVAEEAPDTIAAAAIQPLRALLGVPRAIVNMFDLAAGEVEWLAAAGRHRTHVGPGVRYSMRLMGDVEALRRGEPQVIDTHAQPPGPEVDALLASGVELYMVMPMIAGGELIGALSFGGPPGPFPIEQVNIAREVATQLATAITQARLRDRVTHQAEELEMRVQERTQELRAANSDLEAFSYSVSHDLRTPLRAIDGYAHILGEDYGARLDDEGRRLLAVIRDKTAHMDQLIDDLLRLSRLGRVALSRRRVDMTALARDVSDELTRDAKSRSCEIRVLDLPPVSGDAALVRQVWMNLIGNAIKYTGKLSRAQIEISGRTHDRHSIYCVKDNGAGFDMRYADKLFAVFQRLHSEDEFGGTGAGLAIVHRIVTRHGGKVWAEGRIDEGASFYFSLPFDAATHEL